MSGPNLPNRTSLFLEESSFFDAGIAATSHAGDNLKDDVNALNDSETMIAIARRFLSTSAPSLLKSLEEHSDPKSSSDRLVKIGRNISATMRHASRINSSMIYSKDKIDASLGLLADECSDLAGLLKGDTPKVPKVRFGKTELKMPIITLGCMRFQQSWNRGAGTDAIIDITKVKADCQENLVEILRYAHHCGITHIETAKGYGSSQLQIGFALKTLFDSGEIKREDLIIQTKGGVSSSMTVEDYKQDVLKSMEILKLDYLDLFSVHGLNTQQEFDLLFHNNDEKGNLIIALQELKKEGKVRHIGFSTHGPGDLIRRAIESDAFEYVNLHYHFCGSYTASGDLYSGGNLSNVRLAHEKDMGVFIISVYDKGGRLYAPSNKLRALCLPDMEPMTYGSIWLWQHAMHDEEHSPIHTFVVGAARPSDLDQAVLASHMLLQDPENLAERRERVTSRLTTAMHDALGKQWVDTWYLGVPNAYESIYQTHLTGIVWASNLIKGWGMLDFCKDRYGPMESNLKKWCVENSREDHFKSIFGWTPGCAIDSSLDYTDDFAECPEENKDRLMEAIQFTHYWASEDKKTDEKTRKRIPLEWEVAYDMRPWTAFPER